MASPKKSPKKKGKGKGKGGGRVTRSSTNGKVREAEEPEVREAEEPEVPVGEVHEVKEGTIPGAGLKLKPAQYEEMIDCLTGKVPHEHVQLIDGKLRFTEKQANIGGKPGTPAWKAQIKKAFVYYVDEPRMLKVNGSDREILPRLGNPMPRDHIAIRRLYAAVVEKLKDGYNNNSKPISNYQMTKYLRDRVVHCDAQAIGWYIGTNKSSEDWTVLENCARINRSEERTDIIFDEMVKLKRTVELVGLTADHALLMSEEQSEKLKVFIEQAVKDRDKFEADFKDKFELIEADFKDKFEADFNDKVESLMQPPSWARVFRKLFWGLCVFIVIICLFLIVYYYKGTACERFCQCEYPHDTWLTEDTLTWDEAMASDHRQEFLESAQKEIDELVEKGTWYEDLKAAPMEKPMQVELESWMKYAYANLRSLW